jgi:hypothetical protein
LSAVVHTASQEGDGAETAQQQRLQVARDLLAEADEVVDEAQGKFDAAETMKMLLGARTQPAPDAWLTTVGMMANDPIMHDVSEAGRRIRESEPPVE